MPEEIISTLIKFGKTTITVYDCISMLLKCMQKFPSVSLGTHEGVLTSRLQGKTDGHTVDMRGPHIPVGILDNPLVGIKSVDVVRSPGLDGMVELRGSLKVKPDEFERFRRPIHKRRIRTLHDTTQMSTAIVCRVLASRQLLLVPVLAPHFAHHHRSTGQHLSPSHVKNTCSRNTRIGFICSCYVHVRQMAECVPASPPTAHLALEFLHSWHWYAYRDCSDGVRHCHAEVRI